jgi:predicted N-acetyltransferase YhbS
MPLCLVALTDGAVVATIRYWPITIGDTPSLLLGPVAVDSRCRKAGIGDQLIRCSLNRAQTIGYHSVVLVGDEAYYGRFGFHPASGHGIVMPRETPARVLVLSLGRQRRETSMPSGLVLPWRSVRRIAAAA